MHVIIPIGDKPHGPSIQNRPILHPKLYYVNLCYILIGIVQLIYFAGNLYEIDRRFWVLELDCTYCSIDT